MPKRKKFIDKKSSVSFRLVHRSQRDPLIATDIGEHVLAPIEEENAEKRYEEQHKFGVFYDDDYNYLQHLKDVNEVYSLDGPLEERFRITAQGMSVHAKKDLPMSDLSIRDNDAESSREKVKLQLPSSVLESSGLELRTGLLNQAAPLPGPHPELDPDILAALDDDFDCEDPANKLDDDFILQANAPTDEDAFEDEKRETGDGASSSGEMGLDDDDDEVYGQDETKSRFTAYSMSSSVIRRSDGLQCVDDMFEKLYEQYDEEEVGALDFEADNEAVMGGFLEPDSERMKQMLQEYEQGIREKKEMSAKVLSEKDSDIIERAQMEKWDAKEPMEKIVVEEERLRDRWDCESILSKAAGPIKSTYSTLYNHPTLIKEPPGSSKKKRKVEINEKTGLPDGVLTKKVSGKKLLAQLPGDEPMELDKEPSDRRSRRSQASTYRQKGESPAQRKLRKREVKEERKERRLEKKGNKLAFKEEERRQIMEKLNQKQNMTGIALL